MYTYKNACRIILSFLYFRPFLLDCPCREVRQVFARLLERGICNFLNNDGEVVSK